MPDPVDDAVAAEWQRRVAERSSRTATERSIDRGRSLIRAAVAVLNRSGGEDITVQEVADEAGQSLRTLYQYFESKDDLLLAVFEDTMRSYTQLIADAVAALDDPLDRLAGAMVAAIRLADITGAGLDRSLARLRLKLAEVEPDQVGRAQATLTALIGRLVEEAARAGRISTADRDFATFSLLSLNSAFHTTRSLGNDAGARRPDAEAVVTFGLRGLGADLGEGWYERISGQLTLPTRSGSKLRRQI